MASRAGSWITRSSPLICSGRLGMDLLRASGRHAANKNMVVNQPAHRCHNSKNDLVPSLPEPLYGDQMKCGEKTYSDHQQPKQRVIAPGESREQPEKCQCHSTRKQHDAAKRLQFVRLRQKSERACEEERRAPKRKPAGKDSCWAGSFSRSTRTPVQKNAGKQQTNTCPQGNPVIKAEVDPNSPQYADQKSISKETRNDESHILVLDRRSCFPETTLVVSAAQMAASDKHDKEQREVPNINEVPQWFSANQFCCPKSKVGKTKWNHCSPPLEIRIVAPDKLQAIQVD